MNVSCVTLGIVFLLFLGQLLAQPTVNSGLNRDMLNMDPENPSDMTGLGNKKPKPTPSTWNERASKLSTFLKK